MTVIVIGDVVQVVAGTKRPGPAQVNTQVAMAPVHKGRTLFHQAAKGDEPQEQKGQTPALPV